MRCAACHAEIAKAGLFCPECAAPLAPENAHGDALLAIGAILAIAIYGFRTTLAGRPLWRDEMQP